jgi:hypothetical protein
VGDLILVFYEIQFLFDSWVVLVAVFAHLEEHFNHILHALIDVGLV